MPQVIYKPHCHYQNFSPLANGVYLIAIINKTPLPNETNPIAKMGVAKEFLTSQDFIGVADTVGLWPVKDVREGSTQEAP